MEYHSIRWVDNNQVTRHTREVKILLNISKGKFIKDGSEIDGYGIFISGTGDTEHHLIEDVLILLKKVAEVKCGGFHD